MSLENKVKKYFITAFQANAHVNKKVLDTVNSFCEYQNIPESNLLMIKLPGLDIREEGTPKVLQDKNVLEKDYRLNRNFKVSNFSVRPQQIKPFTGLSGFTRKEGSFVFGSPKQYMHPVPTYDKHYPKFLYTTGVVTDPRYNLKHSIGVKALKDHTYGGLYVEVKNSRIYFARHVTITSNGTGYDLDKQFENKKITTIRPKALVAGDWHTGMTDPLARKGTEDLIKSYKPEKVFLHDFADFASINHHEQGNLIDQVYSYNENGLLLNNELEMIANELKYFVKITPKDTKIYIVKSNHDEFLMRYLNETRFTKEPHNALIASKLLTKAFEGKDPFEEGVKMFYNFPKEKVYFLKADDSVRVGSVELAKHGHKGIHGAKFSLRGVENSTPYQVIGHKHTPIKERNQTVVGTNTILDPRYTSGGLSGWAHGDALVFPRNIVQSIIKIKGEYKV